VKSVTAVYFSEECDRSGVNMCHMDKVMYCDLNHYTGSCRLYTNIGQVGSSKITTAIIDTKGSTHEEHGEPTNG
jgi:hypothetical protein